MTAGWNETGRCIPCEQGEHGTIEDGHCICCATVTDPTEHLAAYLATVSWDNVDELAALVIGFMED